MYGLFYIDNKEKILSFDYYRGFNRDVAYICFPKTLKTPLWNLLENVMILVISYIQYRTL